MPDFAASTHNGEKMKNKRKWFVEICESERQVIVFPSGADFLWHVENNGPITGGVVEVPERTHRTLIKEFKKKDVVARSISWNRYAPIFGFARVDT